MESMSFHSSLSATSTEANFWVIRASSESVVFGYARKLCIPGGGPTDACRLCGLNKVGEVETTLPEGLSLKTSWIWNG